MVKSGIPLFFQKWNFPKKVPPQKYDGLKNMEKPSRALEATLSPSADTNLGHNHSKILPPKKTSWENAGIFESHFLRK